MYAVIETGGKQYRVELGTELAVERLEGAPGDTINFDRVLLVADGDNAQIGTPVVADALVSASVVRQDRGEKVIVFKYRPKARHRSKKGHRQEQTVIRVADIRFSGRSAAGEAERTSRRKNARRARQLRPTLSARRPPITRWPAKLAEEVAARAAQDEAVAKKGTKPKTAAPAATKVKPAGAASSAPTKSAKPAKPAAKSAKPAAKPAKPVSGEPKPSTTPAKSTTARSKATRPSTKKED